MRAALRALRGGALRVLHAAENRVETPSVVLVYHRVASPARDPHALAVTPARFREQMRVLAASRAATRFETLADARTRPRGPKVAVTFDDGYADNLVEALPILEQTGVPACFFVATGYVGGAREFWWDEIERLVPDRGSLPGAFVPEGETRPIAARTVEDRRALRAAIASRLRSLPPAPREALLRSLAEWSGRGGDARAEYRQLTEAELARLAGSPLATIGSHGVTHAAFAVLDPSARRSELVESKAALERWIGRPVTAFAYPYGERHDVPRGAAREVEAAGYAIAAVNRPGQVRRRTHPRRVPRCVVRDWDAREFERRLEEFRVA